MNDTEATIETLTRLRNLGVQIAMDDFGTGYSSLGYLQKFSFDKIKIDRSFVHNLADNPGSRAIIRAVAGLGSTLGIVMTAEGIETEGELGEIIREGCTEAQGFLFGKLPASEIAGIIARLSPRKQSGGLIASGRHVIISTSIAPAAPCIDRSASLAITAKHKPAPDSAGRACFLVG